MTEPATDARTAAHEFLLRNDADKRWFHHLADLDSDDTAVRTRDYDRPVPLHERMEHLRDFVFADLPPVVVNSYEHRLWPREPYASSPLSYVNACGRWDLWAELDRLEWAESAGGAGKLEFWFRNVTVGSKALVTIEVTAAGTMGNIEVRSSAASPRVFPVSGGVGEHTLDLVVTPGSAYAVLVTVQPMAGMAYLAFREVTYQTA